jgi:hypothetical protein
LLTPLVGIMTSTLGRVSFTCLMFRLFGTTQLRKAFLWSLITVNLVVNLVTCITIFTQCGNAESLWDPIGHPSKCWSPNVQAVSLQIPEVLMLEQFMQDF